MLVLVLSWKKPDGLGEGYEWAEAEEGDATTAGEDIDAGLQILHWRERGEVQSQFSIRVIKGSALLPSYPSPKQMCLERGSPPGRPPRLPPGHALCTVNDSKKGKASPIPQAYNP